MMSWNVILIGNANVGEQHNMFLCSEVLLCPTPRKHCQFLLPIAVIKVLLNSKSWRNIIITYKSPNYSAVDPQSVR